MQRISATSTPVKRKANGFTLIEMLVIVAPLMLLLATAVALLINLVTENSRSQARANIAYSMHTTQDVLTHDISGALKFMETKEAAFSDAYGPDSAGGAWSYLGTSGANRVIITKTVATTAGPYDNSRRIAYIDSVGCDPDVIANNPPLTTNTIHFVRNGTLYRRTLTDTSQTLCATSVFQRQSCPPEIDIVDPCKSHDAALVSGVTHFSVSYYNQDGNLLDVYSTPALLDDAVTVEIIIKTDTMIAGESEKYDGKIRVSKLNK